MVAASRRLYLIIEAVAYPRYCEDKAWSLGEGFDLLTQLCYVDVETMGSGMCLAPPNLFQQHLPCKYFASVEDENFEDLSWYTNSIYVDQGRSTANTGRYQRGSEG